MKPHIKKYFLRLAVGLAGYGLGVLAFANFYPHHLPHRTWLILLPVLPWIYIAATIIRHISEKDEMWRKVITEAFAFSAIATGFTCFSYFFVRQSGGPEIPLDYAFYVMWVYYLIGLFFSWRRYK